MSYAQKYFARYSDLDGQQYRIEIWVKGFVGTATEVTAGATPVVVEKNKDVTETYLGGIVPTFYRIELLSGVGFSAATFASENYGDILVKHYIGNTIDFQGIVAPYVSEDLDLPATYSTFTLQAECGLNFLKNAPFPVSDTKTRLLDIIKEATYLIPSHHFFGFKVLDNTKLYSGTTQVAGGIDFFQTFIDRRTFRGMTYYEVIQSLIAVRDEFFFDAGFWWLRNVSELSELYAQPALTTKLVTYDLEGNYVSQDGAYRPSKTVIRQAGGSFGNLFSQKNIRVNRIEPEKINYVLNGEFDKGTTNFVPNNWTAGSEGFSSVLGPDYFKFVDSVFTPDLVSDEAYIQSTAVTWEPFGAFFASPPRDPQKLFFNANVEIGTGISACRFQVIATKGSETYYLTSDFGWVTTPTVAQKKPDSSGIIAFEIPNPPNSTFATLQNFDQSIIYNVTIRLFRSERAFQNTVSQATYFTQYNSVSLFKDSLYTSVLDEYLSTIDYRGNEDNDRENTLILDSIIASQNAFPYRHGSLFTLNETAIDGFASNISGIVGTIYNVYLAQSYLNVTGKRLRYYQGQTFQHIDFSDIVTIDGVSYRIQTYSHDIKNKSVAVRLVELDWVGGIQIDEKLIENNLRQVTTIVQNNSLIPQDFNFVSSVNFDGRTSFGLRPDVRHESVNISEVFLRSEETGLEYAMNWDSDHDLLAVGLSPTFTAKLPQDAVWAGVAAVAITKGQTLYVSGTSGASGKLLVSPFIANGTIPARFLVGIATENAAQGANVHVMRTGILRGINTTAFSAGQDLWASTTVAGGLQATVPTAPNLKLSIAFVVVSHAQVGELAVRINTGHYLADAHDTEVSSIATGQLLRYAGTRWENWTPNFLTGATGTVNTVAKFGANNTLVNTNIVDNGSNVVFSTNIAVGTANAARNVSITRELASADSFSIFSAPTFAPSVTQGFGIDSRAVLAANTALTNLWLNRTSAVTLNTGASITNLYGYFVQAYTNATNIFAFRGEIAAAANRWNLYMSGTAANYLRGNLLVNSTVDSGEAGQFTGNVKITQNLNVPTIGNASGVTANNTWTFSNNVNVPLLPTANTHATSKQYVDNLVATGIKEGIPVRTIALTNITLSGTQTISGVVVVAGNRVLVAGQTTASQNGVYIVAAGAWSRATDSDTDLELRGFNYLITEGTQANARYRNTNDSAITVGTTAITYVIYQGAETDPIFTASPAYGITSQNITDWNTTFANWGALVPITWWDSRFAAASTTGLAEGTNLYFTNTRARSALSFTAGSGAYDSATGVITIPTNNNQITNGAGYITSSALTGYVPTSRTINGFDLTANRTLTTSNIDEGTTNLYFTNARARAAISVSTGLSYNSTTGVITNTITQYTDALARAAISTNATGLTYSSSTGVLSISAGYQIPTTTLLNSFITENQTITLSGDVTGSGRTGIATTLASTGVVAGNYGSATTTPTFTVDAKGRLTAATAVTITPSFANITGKPTTVAGYGITDAITGNGTAGFIPLFSGTQAIGNSVISETSGRIGIGIGAITPSGAIEVRTREFGAWFTRIAGDAGVSNTAFSIQTAGSDVRLFGYGDSTSIWTAPIGGAITRRMTIFSATGNVRLGNLTTDQGERLQVAGTARITTMATGSSADSIVTVTSAGVLNKIDYSTFVPSTRTVNGLALSSNIVLTTSNISEGTNLYYTEARVNANTNVAANTAARHAAVTIGTANGLSLSGQAISLALASSTTTGALSSANWNTFNNKENAIVAGTTAQYYRGDKTFQTLNTTAVTEGTNLYFTNARSRSAISLTINPVISAPSYNASTGVLTLSDYSLLNILTDKQFTDAAAGLRQLRSIEYQANRMDFGFDKVLDVPYLYYENDGKKLVNYMDGDGVFVHVDLNGNQRQYLRAGDIAATVPTLQQVSEAGKSSSIKLQWNAVDYALITDIQAIAIPNLQQVAERGFNANIRLQFNGVNYATMSDLPAVGTVPTLSQVLNSGNNTGSSRINFNSFAEMFAVTNVLYGNGVFFGTESSTADCHIRLQGSSFEISSLRNGVILSAVQSGILQVQANSVRFGNVNYAFNQTPVLVAGNKYVFLWDGSKFVITNF